MKLPQVIDQEVCDLWDARAVACPPGAGQLMGKRITMDSYVVNPYHARFSVGPTGGCTLQVPVERFILMSQSVPGSFLLNHAGELPAYCQPPVGGRY